jgi:hypothetical protein
MLQLLPLYCWFFGFFVAEKHPVFQNHSDIIAQCSEMYLYKIAAQPTAAAAQDSARSYLEDYEIFERYVLEDAELEAFRDLVLDKNQYIEDKKMCPMQAQYALLFRKKKHYIALLVSSPQCEKVLVLSSEKNIHKHYHDLREQNQLRTMLRQWD